MWMGVLRPLIVRITIGLPQLQEDEVQTKVCTSFRTRLAPVHSGGLLTQAILADKNEDG
jgi:hypothetical protein